MGEEPEFLRKILKEHGVIDDEGKVIDALEQKLLRWSQEREQSTSEE